jgi:hypothetical protein
MEVTQNKNTRNELLDALQHIRLQEESSGVTRAFVTACRQAPQLVETESDPLLFLDDDGSPQAAALRMAIYWSKRFLSFHNRAFLPLHDVTTGHGALSPSVIVNALAQSYSYLQLLPTTGADSRIGRAVFLIDAAKATNLQHDAQVRCLFYRLDRARDCLLSSSQGGGGGGGGGITFLLLPVDTVADFVNLEQLMGVLSVLIGTDCRPFRSRKFHILSSSAAPTSTTTAMAVRQLVEMKSLSEECIVTVGASPQDIIQQLQESFYLVLPSKMDAAAASTTTGTPQESLRVTQGTMSLCECSTQHGGAAGSASTTREHDLERKPAAKRNGTTNAPPTDAHVDNAGDVSDRKRRKTVVSFSAHHESRDDTPASNAAASAVMTDSVPSEEGKEHIEPAEEKRRRNALYSKRKYDRKKIEAEVMQKQCHQLHVENQRLRNQQTRLQELLASAQECVQNDSSATMPAAAAAPLLLSSQPRPDKQVQPRVHLEQAQQYLLQALQQRPQEPVVELLQALQLQQQQQPQQEQQKPMQPLFNLVQEQQEQQQLMSPPLQQNLLQLHLAQRQGQAPASQTMQVQRNPQNRQLASPISSPSTESTLDPDVTQGFVSLLQQLRDHSQGSPY